MHDNCYRQAVGCMLHDSQHLLRILFHRKKRRAMTPEKYGIVQLNGFPSYCTVLQKFRDSKERAKLRMWPPYKTPLLTHMYVSFSSTLHLSQVIKQSSKHKLVRVSIRIIKATYNRQTTSSELRYSGLARIYVESWKEDTTREVEIKSQKVYLNSFFFARTKRSRRCVSPRRTRPAPLRYPEAAFFILGWVCVKNIIGTVVEVLRVVRWTSCWAPTGFGCRHPLECREFVTFVRWTAGWG